MTRSLIILVFSLFVVSAPAQETARNIVAPSRPPPPPLTECKATPITTQLKISGPLHDGWSVTCTITYADETWFDARIPLPVGATRKEALKAIDNFMGHRAPEILKAHGWVVEKSHGRR